MSLRSVIAIYTCEDKYLYEIVEDYKDAQSKDERDAIANAFFAAVWSVKNQRRTYTKTIHFKVRRDLLDTELGQIFAQWSSISYQYYKPLTKEENWRFFIRQKINNIYTRHFDREVILEKEYMDCLKTPKRLYCAWQSGASLDPRTATDSILNAMEQAAVIKARLQKQKLTLPWDTYKGTIEGFLRRCLENCRLIEEYEADTVLPSRFSFITEDHFYVSYINRCLDGEIRKWEKRKYGLPQNSRKGYMRCQCCGAMMEKDAPNRKYCPPCSKKKRAERNHSYYVKTVLNSRFSA